MRPRGSQYHPRRPFGRPRVPSVLSGGGFWRLLELSRDALERSWAALGALLFVAAICNGITVFTRLTPHAADPFFSIITSRRGRRITRETREGRREDQKEKSDETERRDGKKDSI